MGVSEAATINKKIEMSFNKALSVDNRTRFFSFLSFQPWLDAINAALIFDEMPESIYVAGSTEWAESGRSISKDNIDKPIEVMLPYLEMTDKGFTTKNEEAKKQGLVIYGKFPKYELKYAKCFMYDYMQTEGETDEFIEKMPDEPDFFKAFRSEDNVSIEYTDDELYLQGLFSYYDRTNSEEEVLYIREGISKSQENMEIIKALLDHRYDLVHNYGYLTTGEAVEYKKRVIKAVSFMLSSRYSLNEGYEDLIFINYLEDLDIKKRIRFVDDALLLLKSVIDCLDEITTFDLNEVMLIRALTPAIILFSQAKNMEEGKRMILIYLKKISVSFSTKENETIFVKTINNLYKKIDGMPDEVYFAFIDKIKHFRMYSYPVFAY